MKYKLICIDMDGTLLNDNNEVSTENKLALQKCLEKGIHIAINTGRFHASAKSYITLLNLDCHIISCNGTYIQCKDTEKVLYSAPLTSAQLHKINSVFKSFNLKSYFNSINKILIEGTSNNDEVKDDNNFIQSKSIIQLSQKENYPIYRATAVEDIDKAKLLKAKIILEKHSDLEVVTSMPNNFDVMQGGTSKGNGVKELSKILKISRDEIICIGDNENDISMINFAAVGVAMGNATEDLKIHANYITDTNNNSGVAKAIEKFILDI